MNNSTNNLQVARSTLDNTVHEAIRNNIPFCKAGIEQAVKTFLIEVCKMNSGITHTIASDFRQKYECDCKGCTS